MARLLQRGQTEGDSMNAFGTRLGTRISSRKRSSGFQTAHNLRNMKRDRGACRSLEAVMNFVPVE